MVREIFDDFYNEILKEKAEALKLRKSLRSLREECKEESGKQALLYYLDEGKQKALLSALGFQDAKVRKNAALLLGILGKREFLPELFAAYEREEQLFVRGAYLQAVMEFDFRPYVKQLSQRKQVLEQMEFTEENLSSKKHIDEEYHLLSEMLLMMEGRRHHEFCGYHEFSDIILLTNRNHVDVTMKELEKIGILDGRATNIGVIVRTDRVHKLFQCRTFAEALFILPVSGDERKGILSRNLIPGLTAERLYSHGTDLTGAALDAEISSAAKAIVKAGLLEFMQKRHKGKAPFYFRIEWKGKVEASKKGTLIRRLAAEIERESDYQLVNSTGNYDMELRIIENSKGGFHFMIRLYTIPEERFSYRINSVAESIRPVNAALAAALAEKYFVDNARILDPFCGVGTMLIERHKRKKADTMYGIDIYGKAIEAARENTEAARAIVHYVNRDFFDFRHEYLFDEIFTNMPMATGKQREEDVEKIYQRFFEKAPQHLTKQGIVIMYTHHMGFARRYAKANGFYLADVYEISKVAECFVAVFRRK